MTGRAVFTVTGTVTARQEVLVDAPADIDPDELIEWVADCAIPDLDRHLDLDLEVDLDVDRPRIIADRVVADSRVLCPLIHVVDNDLMYLGVAECWEDLVALRRRINPDPKAPAPGQRDVFGGIVS